MEQNKNAVAKEETEKVQKTTKQTSAKKPVVEKAQAPEKPQPDIEKLLAAQREEFEKRLAEQQKEFEERLAAQTRAYMASSGSDQVTLLYMGLSMRGASVDLGSKELGTIEGNGGIKFVPKHIFLQNLNETVMKRLRDRRLIVLDGMTDEERERYGISYKDGEILPRDIFNGNLLSMKEEEILRIFKLACKRHKSIVASLIIEAYQNGDNRINQELVEKLNAESKSVDKNGMFTSILKDMGRQMGE